MTGAAASQPDKILLTDVDDHIVRITMNRPEKRNALDQEARTMLLDAMAAVEKRAKVVIVSGAGATFSSGMDLSQIADGGQGGQDELNRSWIQVLEAIRRHPAVFIAAARGFALGGGSTLINVCDLAVVARDVQIGMPEIGFGFYPGLAGPATQLRLSAKHAAWMVLTAKRIDGQTAVDWGMANVVCDDADVEDEALALARHVAQFDAVALEWSKKALWHIPMNLREWRAVLEFGEYTNAQIHARTDSHRTSLEKFAAGEANPGQGTNW